MQSPLPRFSHRYRRRAPPMPQLPEDHVSLLRQARDPPQDGLAVPPAPLQELQPHSERGRRFAVPMWTAQPRSAPSATAKPPDAVEGNPEWEALGFYLPVVRVRALQRLRHREGDSGQGGEEKARSRGAGDEENPKLKSRRGRLRPRLRLRLSERQRRPRSRRAGRGKGKG